MEEPLVSVMLNGPEGYNERGHVSMSEPFPGQPLHARTNPVSGLQPCSEDTEAEHQMLPLGCGREGSRLGLNPGKKQRWLTT